MLISHQMIIMIILLSIQTSSFIKMTVALIVERIYFRFNESGDYKMPVGIFRNLAGLEMEMHT